VLRLVKSKLKKNAATCLNAKKDYFVKKKTVLHSTKFYPFLVSSEKQIKKRRLTVSFVGHYLIFFLKLFVLSLLFKAYSS